jgi:hypothetical protein
MPHGCCDNNPDAVTHCSILHQPLVCREKPPTKDNCTNAKRAQPIG